MAGTATISWTSRVNPPLPTIVSNSNKSGSGALVHNLVSVTAGALILVTTTRDSADADCVITSSPSITWTKRVDSRDCNAELHTAVFSAGGSLDVTVTWSGGSIETTSVCYVITGQEPALGGTSTVTSGGSPDPPSASLTTTRANSIIFCVAADRNGVSGAARTYLDSATEIFYFPPGGHTAYHFYKEAVTVGSYTEGLTAPSGQQGGSCYYEIRTLP